MILCLRTLRNLSFANSSKIYKRQKVFQTFSGFLRTICRFSTITLFKHIIKVLGTKEDKDRLKEYKKKFHQYAKRRVYECPPQFGPESKTGHADVFVKVDSQYENYTVTEIEGFRQS